MGHHVSRAGCLQPSPHRKDASPWDTSGSPAVSLSSPPGYVGGARLLVLRADPPFGGLQPVLGCSCPHSGTRHHSRCPMGSCLAEKDSGLLVSCHSPSDTPGQL